MKLAEKYQAKSLRFLVELLENPADYTEKAVDAALTEIARRQPDREEALAIAEEFQRERCRKMVEKFSIINDKVLEPPVSHFLPAGRTREILKEEFDEYFSKKGDMKPDSWKYILGAIG